MPSEKKFVRSLQPRLESAFIGLGSEDSQVKVDVGRRLTYAYEILGYDADGPARRRSSSYQTDLLIYDSYDTGTWIPRVVIECKVSSVTTHDALTYSRKAATHKQVQPYRRYGILVANYGEAVPPRLVRHGAFFDFMLAWNDLEPTEMEWSDLLQVVTDEVRASRQLQELLADRSRSRPTYRLLHRPLRLERAKEPPSSDIATSG